MEAGVQTVQFQGGENVGRSFAVCLHDLIFRTEKESSIWRQNDHRDIMQNLPAHFIFQEECRMEIKHVLVPSVFQTYGSVCRKVILNVILEPTKIGSLKTDHVNEPLHMTPITNSNSGIKVTLQVTNPVNYENHKAQLPIRLLGLGHVYRV